MSLGKEIVRLRMQKQWKQKDLAEHLGVHQRQLSRWESDQVRPRGRTLEKIAKALGTSAHELEVTGTGNPSWTGRIKDPELQQLLEEVPSLEDGQREALKMILKDMVTRRRLEAVLGR